MTTNEKLEQAQEECRQLVIENQLLKDIRRYDMRQLGAVYEEIAQLEEANEYHRKEHAKLLLPLPPDTQHYRSEGKPYDVALDRDGATITARVWDMPESVRGTGTLVRDDYYGIRSIRHPNIDWRYLWVRGKVETLDNDTPTCTFPTVASARDYFTHITALLDRLNAEHVEPVPQYDGEKIDALLDAIIHHRFMCGIYIERKDNELYVEHYAKSDAATTALLAALGLE